MEDQDLEAHAQKRKRFDGIDMGVGPDGANLASGEPNENGENHRADSDHV